MRLWSCPRARSRIPPAGRAFPRSRLGAAHPSHPSGPPAEAAWQHGQGLKRRRRPVTTVLEQRIAVSRPRASSAAPACPTGLEYVELTNAISQGLGRPSHGERWGGELPVCNPRGIGRPFRRKRRHIGESMEAELLVREIAPGRLVKAVKPIHAGYDALCIVVTYAELENATEDAINRQILTEWLMQSGKSILPGRPAWTRRWRLQRRDRHLSGTTLRGSPARPRATRQRLSRYRGHRDDGDARTLGPSGEDRMALASGAVSKRVERRRGEGRRPRLRAPPCFTLRLLSRT